MLLPNLNASSHPCLRFGFHVLLVSGVVIAVVEVVSGPVCIVAIVFILARNVGVDAFAVARSIVAGVFFLGPVFIGAGEAMNGEGPTVARAARL